MNTKQKLLYMFIGCIFTLVGYFLASLTNHQPLTAHGQENTNSVIDEIVCKKIKVVNSFGTTMAVIKGTQIGG